MNTPKWNDVYTTEELAAALDHHAAQLAHRYGLYDIANELRAAAQCIDDLLENNNKMAGELATFAGAAFRAMENIDNVARALKASTQSLSRMPDLKGQEAERAVDDALHSEAFPNG